MTRVQTMQTTGWVRGARLGGRGVIGEMAIRACAVVLSAYSVALGACAVVGTEHYSPAAVPQQPRPYLFLLYMLAENELATAALAAIRELESYPNEHGAAHVVAAVQLPGGEQRTYLIQPYATTAPQIRSPQLPLPSRDLYSAAGMTAQLRSIQELAPAHHAVLVLWGHGRGWRGVGAADPSDRMLNGVEIAQAVRDVGVATIVLDGAWTAHFELLYELAHSAPADFAALAIAGPISGAGMSYATILEGADRHGWHASGVRTAFDSEYRRITLDPEAGLLHATRQQILDSAGALHEATRTVGPLSWESARPLRETFNATAVLHPATDGWDLSVTLAQIFDALNTPPHDRGAPELGSARLYYVSTDALGFALRHGADYAYSAPNATVPALSETVGWAPDFVHQTGLLFELWYRP